MGQVIRWIGLWTIALLAAGVLGRCWCSWSFLSMILCVLLPGMRGCCYPTMRNCLKQVWALSSCFFLSLSSPTCCPPMMITSWNNNNWTLFISFIIIVIITLWCNQAQLLERVGCGSHFGFFFRKTKIFITNLTSSFLLCNTTEVSYVLVNNFNSICDLLLVC